MSKEHLKTKFQLCRPVAIMALFAISCGTLGRLYMMNHFSLNSENIKKIDESKLSYYDVSNILDYTDTSKYDIFVQLENKKIELTQQELRSFPRTAKFTCFAYDGAAVQEPAVDEPDGIVLVPESKGE